MPIKGMDYDWVKKYVSDPDKIRKHSFLPLIHKSIIKRKFRSDKLKRIRNPKNKLRRIKSDPKERHIFFASHLDAMVYSKYNELISKKYEYYISDLEFNRSIVAYRKIPHKKSSGNMCSIDFARIAFEFIKSNQSNKLSVIVADIKSFFDNLDHTILKKQWSKILNKITLPPDHYNIYKSLTRIKYVESNMLFNCYNKEMIVSRGLINNNKISIHKRKKINSHKYFKEKNAISYCTKQEFLNNNLNLIISKNNESGIPQGIAISATLANIYMLDFDERIYNLTKSINAFYQRYSDDIIIVCEQNDEVNIISQLNRLITSEHVNLTIESNKTKLYHFEIVDNVYTGFEVDIQTRIPSYNKPLEYLGFTFDGHRVLIKSSGFSKYYRNMKHALNRSAALALKSKNPDDNIFKSKLYKRFTYKGSARRMKFRPSFSNPKKYTKTYEYNWGNYLSYIYKSNNIMSNINKNNAIRKQSRKMWAKFNSLLKQKIENVRSGKA